MSGSRHPEVLLAQVHLPLRGSRLVLDEDEACGVHVHQVVDGVSKVNPVPQSLLWRGGCVKKCRLLELEQNQRTTVNISISISHHQTSQDELSAKETECVDWRRKLKSLDQRSSRVEIFH